MRAWSVVLLALVAACAQAREPVVGLPCENCEAVFEGMPKTIGSHTRIGTATEPGQPMLVSGRVHDASGRAVAGVIVYAYHTNDEGIYPTSGRPTGMGANRHGLLRAWARSDAQGRYRFDTIRPAGYPGTDIPQHIHMHVIEPGRGTYWIDDVTFDDDPRLTEAQIRSPERARRRRRADAGGREGVWQVTRDIELGRNIPGYGQCGSRGG